VDWESQVPGGWVLRHRVDAGCGRASDLGARLGYRFGDWVEPTRLAAPSTVAVVESAVAAHLERAARVGRGFGTAVGIALGTAIGGLVALLAWTVLG
jgi:hypothetical protein